jgi:predicted NAD/FAD-dependent oxidoreductase
MSQLSRKSFIKWVLSAGAVMRCPMPAHGEEAKSKGQGQTLRFESETNEICHKVRDGHELDAPAPSKKVDVVIVGAGPSGLAAADAAQGSDFLLLEKEEHVGGNAYTEEWEGLSYCTGSAWATIFTPEVEAMFKRWKFDLKPIQGLDAACFKGQWIEGLWDSNPEAAAFERLPYSPSVKKSFRDFCRKIEKIDMEKDKDALDNRPFSDFLKDHAPELTAYWDCFGPSNWGCLSADTSALLGLQAARDWPKAVRYTFEGGLGQGSRKIHAALTPSNKKRVLGGCTVVNVAKDGKRVHVSFMKDGKMETVSAKSVVMATPKFITRMIVQGLPAEQTTAMSQLRYAPYLVFNLCFDRVVYNLAYDNFVVGAKHFTDFIPADFVTHAKGGELSRKQVITVYAPRQEEHRKLLLKDEWVVAEAQAAAEELVGMFPGWADHLREVRMYRRGHPMPMSTPGAYTRVQPAASVDAPPIYFAHSDSSSDVSDLAYGALNGIAAAKKALTHL